MISGLVRKILAVTLFFLSISGGHASPLSVQKVTDGVYAIVGELAQRSSANLGNNATFGFVVTNEGVVLIDSGGSYKGAARIDAAIHRVTKEPVVLVINTGGQDQRWHGNDYFKRQGAKIIAAVATVADQKARAGRQLEVLENLVGKQGMAGTREIYADRTFQDKLDITVGGVQFQLRQIGPAHTPGDTFVWLPQTKVVFSGDIVYVERMLTVGSVSNSKGWIHAYETLAALQPAFIVPGHGHVTDLKQARADTYDYLVALRLGVNDLLESGAGLESVSRIDQSRFRYLKFYNELKGPNAHRVFREMEWE
jgi:glyoxylase-like metal-dependent hydrolase (beta-lactamase superfamily II)